MILATEKQKTDQQIENLFMLIAEILIFSPKKLSKQTNSISQPKHRPNSNRNPTNYFVAYTILHSIATTFFNQNEIFH
jgi:hypothetical protein